MQNGLDALRPDWREPGAVLRVPLHVGRSALLLVNALADCSQSPWGCIVARAGPPMGDAAAAALAGLWALVCKVVWGLAVEAAGDFARLERRLGCGFS